MNHEPQRQNLKTENHVRMWKVTLVLLSNSDAVLCVNKTQSEQMLEVVNLQHNEVVHQSRVSMFMLAQQKKVVTFLQQLP